MSRRRPLHTCGVSALAIIYTACRRAQELNGPIGKLTKRMTTSITSAFPFIFTMQYQWLAILSFTDDHILILEKVLETIFPPSSRIFDKIDKLVYKAECIPGRFDEALSTVPIIMHHVPFLDWVVMHLIWWLNFLITTLTEWGSKNTKEKDIMVDTSCNTCSNVIESPEKANCPIESPACGQSWTEESLSITCPPQEKNIEVGTTDSHVELPAITESDRKEELLPLGDPLESESHTDDNLESPAESFISALSENVFSSTPSNSFRDEIPNYVSRVELPGFAEYKNKEELCPVSDLSEDERKIVSNEECPAESSTPAQSENDISSPMCDSLQDETKSRYVIFDSSSEGRMDKEMSDQGMKEKVETKLDDNAMESSPQDKERGIQKGPEEVDRKDSDPILDLFEAKWHMR